MAGTVVRPAAIPVRAFPRILVVAGNGDESAVVARRLAAHLDGSTSEVRTPTPDELAALRARGALRPGTVVVSVDAALVQDERATWGRRDTLDCGPGGCIESQRPAIQATPVVIGRVRITVTDGPSGRSLQREDLREEEVGPDVLGARLRVIERLGERTTALVDQRAEPVVVELLTVDVPEVRTALTLIEGGDWAHGAAALQAFVDSPAMDTLPPQTRARVLYDLGQARRFDGSLPPDERFARAAEAMRAAIRTIPDRRYAAGIAEIQADQRSRALLLAQEEARDHNFRLASDGGAVPEPPTSYRAGP